jgi:hypothetical protein
MIEFPEGIELYELVAADLDADDVTFVIPVPGKTLSEAGVVEVRKMRGSLGWTEELRVLVIFDGAPVPVFESSTITDAEISLECASGDRLLRLEAEQSSDTWTDSADRHSEDHDPDSLGY